jgi:hypothetical protein
MAYLAAIAIWYDRGTWLSSAAIAAVFCWFIGRSFREAAVTRSLMEHAPPERAVLCLCRGFYIFGRWVVVAFCILSALDELDDGSGLLDWDVGQPVSMGSPASTALGNVGVALLLWSLGGLGMWYLRRFMNQAASRPTYDRFGG